MIKRNLLLPAVFLLTLVAVSPARPWPPTNLQIINHDDACGVIYMEYTGRDGVVKIVTTAKDACLDLRTASRFPLTGPNPGHPADISIADGWLYLIGKEATVGTATIVGAAESSKLIVDSRHQSANTARILYPGTGGNGKVWYVGQANSEKVLEAGKGTQSQKPLPIPTPTLIAANDPVVTEIKAALAICRQEGHEIGGIADP
jgi:hypothetical protein